MLFNSIQFLIFFPIVVMIYFITPDRFRWLLLLLASYFFYMCWKAKYIILILISTLVDYFAGMAIGRSQDRNKKMFYLTLSLFTNLGILFGFKYFNFFSHSTKYILNHFDLFYDMPTFHMLLPVGISFYTFQTLSYTIDVYQGKQTPEKHLGKFALYVAFFPQLVAGPIERSTRLLPQFYRKYNFDYERVTDGLKLMLWGFFKKLVVADRLAMFVDTVYDNPTEYQGISLILATVFFAFQIYCDFSGYSDIAIGAAQVMGFRLMENFNRPYFAKSISDFWRRWHISLSSWFRDYLYIPLGGNRVTEYRWVFNLFIVFILSGLWHGANWTFIIWGALHGFYIIIAILTKPFRLKVLKIKRLNRYPAAIKFLNVVTTFSLVCFAWIFFRADNLGDALYIVRHLCAGIDSWLLNIIHLDNHTKVLKVLLMGQSGRDFIIAVTSIALIVLVHLIQRHYCIRQILQKMPIWVRWWTVYYTGILLILLFRVSDTTPFLYFQF